MKREELRDIVSQAFRLAEPEVLRLIDLYNWGPRWLAVEVYVNGLGEPMHVIYGMQEEWNPAWGRGDDPLDFVAFANRKRLTARHHQMDSGLVLEVDLKEGEINWKGGVIRSWGDAGASGIKSFADELAAEYILGWIRLLIHQATE